MIGDHEEEKHEEEADPPWGPTGAVERFSLCRPHKEQGPPCGDNVEGEEEEERRHHEDELDLVEEAHDRGLVGGVP